MSRNPKELIEALRNLLSENKSSTQEGICNELEKQGFEVNQSKISRLLRKIGAVKMTNVNGLVVYSLPREPAPPSLGTPLRDLIFDITRNENLILIATSPGCASTIGRILDHHQATLEILGTIAGDDTLVVFPRTIADLPKLLDEIIKLLK